MTDTASSHHRTTTEPRRRPAWRLVLALAAIAVLLLAGCSSGGNDDSSSGDDATSSPGEAGIAGGGDGSGTDGGSMADSDDGEASGEEATEGGVPAGAAAARGAAQPLALTPADLGRSVVYTAAIELQAEDVEGTSREAQLAVTALGGLVFGQQTTTDPQPRTVLVFKVAPEQFSAALDALGGIGEVVSQDVSADDVTDRIVDLRSQISSTEVSVQRLRALLADAPSLEAIAALEGQLLQRETALEQMRGQLRTLEDQVSLATITVTISQPAATPRMDVEVSMYAGDDEGQRCPGDDELSVDEGDSLVMCLSIENGGNVSLTEIEVRDHGLGLDPDDVTLVDFAEDDVLAPGDTVIAWAQVPADPDQFPSPDVSAVALDEGGTQLRVGVESTTTPIELTVNEDESLPGFGDSIASGFSIVATLLGVLTVVLGLLVPLLVVVVPLVAAAWWWRRRSARGASDQEPTLSTT